MPELPEVETVRRGLEEKFIGRRIDKVEVGRQRSVRRTSREEVIARLTGVTAIAALIDEASICSVHLIQGT